MPASVRLAGSLRMLVRLSVVLGTVLLTRGNAAAVCVGDCSGNNVVTVNEMIIGVNIVLGLQPASACPAFENARGEVDIAQLIKGVNNLLNGCPVEDTPTTTPTNTSTATPPDTATVTASATSTATRTATETFTETATPTQTSIPTGTATATATPTATGAPTGTATATITPTATPTDTPTGEPSLTPTDTPSPAPSDTPTSGATATPTDTSEPTATPTEAPSATPSATPSEAPSATPSETPTGAPSATPTETATSGPSATPTDTATTGPTATPTDTPNPVGEEAAGRAAIVATGLNGIQSVVAAVITSVTGGGAGALVAGGPAAASEAFPRGAAVCNQCPVEPPGTDCDCCPVSGITTQACTSMGSGGTKTIHLELGSTDCVSGGPAGGTAEFDGTVTLDSTPSFLNSCSPVAFFGAAFDVGNVSVLFRNNQAQTVLSVGADLTGNLSLTPQLGSSCLVSALTLTLNGTLTSTLPTGDGVQVEFQNTQVMMTDITFNDDCVPLKYTLTFNGNATFTPMQDGLVEVTSTLTTGGAPVVQTQNFAVQFTNFMLVQDASVSPPTVMMTGDIASDCFGGTVSLSTLTPVAVAAGQICPTSGSLNVSGSGQTATVTYMDGMVTVSQSGMMMMYPTCLAPALLMCAS